jgi:DNA-directed RNA polymerase subunit omega
MRIEEVMEEALSKVDDNKYILSVVVAKRANQLMKGAKPMYETDTKIEKFTTIALNEIAKDLIDAKDFINK